MSHESLREEYIDKGGKPEDVDNELSKAEHLGLDEEQTRNQLDRTIGKH